MENPNEIQTPQLPAPKKWYRHAGILWIVALAIVAGLCLWLYSIKQPTLKNAEPPVIIQNSSNTSTASSASLISTSTIPQIDTSDWKTFNSPFSFSIQYPPDWFATSTLGEENVEFSNNSSQPPLSEQALNSVAQFSINWESGDNNLSVESWYDSVKNGFNDPPTFEGTTTIDGYEAIKTVIPKIGEWTHYYVAVDSNVFNIGYLDEASASQPSQFLPIYQAILNSIKFSQFQSSPNGTSATQPAIDDQYSLFDPNQLAPQGLGGPIQYQDDGIINSGPYSGYHRVIAGVQNDAGPETWTQAFVFATKDYQSFIADAGSAYYNSPASLYNKSKVVGVGNIPMDYPPESVSLENFVLTRGDNGSGATLAIDMSPSLGNKLSSGIPGFTLYGDTDLGNVGSTSPVGTYLAGSTSVYAVDSAGLAYIYSFYSIEESKRAAQDNNFYDSSEFNFSGSFYTNYDGLFPGGCDVNQAYVLQNISQSDLTQVGSTVLGTPLYTLKDPNNPINQGEYASKVSDYQDEFQEDNGVAPPSYQQYLAKNPVLIFQDPWGRWIGLGEYEYQLPGGCGKPVIYLYPTKPTEITVKFLNPMRFSVDIPAYNNGWDVLANPDGELKNLQSPADQTIYPYLYWEGQTAAPYPPAQTGWIVAQKDLSSFLNDKLTAIGLNGKEKTDMEAYWLPELLAKNTPYYRLSFFQTATMDKFIPMGVTPKPDTVIRVFLDWSPLTSLPPIPPQPEILNHIDRKGFTLVEWGGLKQ